MANIAHVAEHTARDLIDHLPLLQVLVPFCTAPVIVLLVSVSVVARPTNVSVEVGNVKVPVLTIVAITGAVKVLFVNVSAPARVARVPVVGRVTLVAAVEVSVVANAPAVIKLPPETTVRVPVVLVIVKPLTVLLVNASEPARVARVPVVGSVTEVFAVAVKVCVNAPA